MKQNVQSLLFKEISELCKAYKIKASQRYLTIYKRIDPLLWHAFIAKWAQSPEQIQFMAEVQIKPLDFDDIDAKITKPETVVKHSDFYRANPGYHSFEIEKKSTLSLPARLC